MPRGEETLVADARTADVGGRIPAGFTLDARKKGEQRLHGAPRGDGIVAEADVEHGRADGSEDVVGEISIQVRREVSGPQAPAAPLFEDTARQREAGPAAAGGHIALDGERCRAMHAPEPPREILERRLLPG